MTAHDQSPNLQVLLNRLCNELESSWRSGRPGQRIKIETLLTEVADADRQAVLSELVALEIDCRRAAGEEPQPWEYAGRFAELHDDTLESMFSAVMTETRVTDFSAPIVAGDTVTLKNVTVREFLERLEASGLAVANESTRHNDVPTASCDQLAKRLVRDDHLTAYQAEVLRTGSSEPLVLGEYTVVGRIGAGGMGAVYRAVHSRMKRTVALKILRVDLADAPQRRKRFQREVEAAAQLSHPNIVTAYDAGEVDSVHYLITEFVDGQDLSDVVRNRGPLSFGEAMRAVLQAAKGLAYAHQQGVIHRDIKPSNLLMDKDGTVKVLDMGLARFDNQSANAAQTELTTDSMVMGTVDYMSPEQAVNTKAADEKSDIYSLGCTLFFLLSGRTLYDGDTIMQKVLAHRDDPIPIVADFVRVPPTFQAVFEQLVAKDKGARPDSMTEVINLFSQFKKRRQPSHEHDQKTTAESTSAAVTHQTNTAVAEPEQSTLIAESSGRLKGKTRRSNKRSLWVAGTCVIGALLAVAIYFVTTGATGPSDVTPEELEWTELFDGSTLTGWEPNENGDSWRVENGAIVGQGKRSMLFFTARELPTTDFELEAEVMTAPSTNSGIYFCTSPVPLRFPDAVGYEAQINNSAADIKKTGGLWKHADRDTSPVSDNEWFRMSIRVEGSQVEVRVNDEITAALDDSTERRLTGKTVGLQCFNETGSVRFRKIRIRSLVKSNPELRRALEFNGRTSHVDIDMEFDHGGELTVEAWLTPAELPAAHVPIIRTPPPDHAMGMGLAFQDGRPMFGVGVDTGWKLTASRVGVSPRERIHLAGVYDKEGLRVYVNGKLFAAARSVFPRTPLPSPLVMAPADDQGRRFQGTIDEFRICGRALYSSNRFSPADPLKPDDSDIVMFHFEASDAGVLFDSSPNQNHGQIIDARRVKVD